jgi:hypothetical protein
MRNIINTIANVTTTGIAVDQVRTVMAGVVDALRAAPRHLHLYAAPAPKGWALFTGKQMPGTGSLPGGEQLSCSRRERSRCRRPRESSCLRACR